MPIVSEAPNLTALWESYRAGRPKARTDLIEAYIGVVRWIVSSEPDRLDLEPDDLVGFGIVGLVDAIEKFDPSRGLTFVNYATPRIRGSIRDQVRVANRIPDKVNRRSVAVSRATSILEGRLGRHPSNEEIARELDTTVRVVEKILQVDERLKLTSLDRTTNDEDGAPGTLADVVYSNADSPEATFDVEEMRLRLATAVLSLTRLHRVVLALRYRERLKLQQIAVVLGVHTTRASQLRDEAIEALRVALAGAHVNAFLGGPR